MPAFVSCGCTATKVQSQQWSAAETKALASNDTHAPAPIARACAKLFTFSFTFTFSLASLWIRQCSHAYWCPVPHVISHTFDMDAHHTLLLRWQCRGRTHRCPSMASPPASHRRSKGKWPCHHIIKLCISSTNAAHSSNGRRFWQDLRLC